jgi:tetratricopeptide (TPR) repeat protein
MKAEHISDASIIILLWRITERMRERGEGLGEKCMLNVEKMLHLTVQALERKTIKASPYNFTEELAGFVQHINKVTMETFNKAPE